MIAPFLVQLHKPVKLRLKLIHGRGRLVRLGFKTEIGRRLRWISRLGRLVGFAFPLFVEFRVGPGNLFEHGILLQFLLDECLQFERRRLKQCEGLLELGSQHQRLCQALRQL